MLFDGEREEKEADQFAKTDIASPKSLGVLLSFS